MSEERGLTPRELQGGPLGEGPHGAGRPSDGISEGCQEAGSRMQKEAADRNQLLLESERPFLEGS